MRCDDFLTMTGNETNLPVTSDRQQVLAQAREMGLRLSDDGTRWVPIGIENTHIDYKFFMDLENVCFLGNAFCLGDSLL